MTTDTQIQVVPAIFNGTITKLEKKIAAAWGQLERAVQSKDITATRAAVNRLAHLEELRLKHVALEQKIADTISNARSSQTAPVAETISSSHSSTQTQSAPVLERSSIDLSIQTAPVLEERVNGSATQSAPVLETVFNGPISQIATVLESISNSAQTASVPESVPNISPSQTQPVLQSSSVSSGQTAPVPNKVPNNGSSTQASPVPENVSNNGASTQTAPDAQTPVARPKKKPVRPVEIKFGSVKKHIRYATEIPVTIANWLIEQGKELPITANFIHPSDAGFSQSATTKKLKSGQYMRVGHNQEALLHKARELLDSCGYEGTQIKVLLDNGITLSA